MSVCISLRGPSTPSLTAYMAEAAAAGWGPFPLQRCMFCTANPLTFDLVLTLAGVLLLSLQGRFEAFEAFELITLRSRAVGCRVSTGENPFLALAVSERRSDVLVLLDARGAFLLA